MRQFISYHRAGRGTAADQLDSHVRISHTSQLTCLELNLRLLGHEDRPVFFEPTENALYTRVKPIRTPRHIEDR